MLEKLKSIIIIPLAFLIAACVHSCGGGGGGSGGNTPVVSPPTFKEIVIKDIAARVVPNSIISNPVSGRENLILSYTVPKDDPAYNALTGISWTYDIANFVVAKTILEDYDHAKKTLTAVCNLVDEQGRLGFSYNTINNNYDQLYRTGTNAWVGYAATFYQQKSGDNSFQGCATDIADFLLTLQDETGSLKGSTTETWYSTEHNIDAYFFFRDLGRITNNSTYSSAANKIKTSLLQNHWNTEKGRFNRGINDPVDALDCTTWGTLFLLAIGEDTKAVTNLAYAENFKIAVSYDGQTVNGFESYIGNNAIWVEGTLGYVLAKKRIGDAANKYFEEMKKLYIDGGFMHTYPQTNDSEDLACAVANNWYIIAESNDELFWNQ